MPRVYQERGGTTHREAGSTTRGFTLVASHWSDDDWMPRLRLLDPDGGVLHAWHVDPDALAASGAGEGAPPIGPERAHHLALRDRDIHGAHLMPDGDLVLTLEYVGTLRIDACSRVEWALHEENHHTVVRADDGTFLGGSRVLAVSPGSDSTTVLFAPDDSLTFYTEFLGNSQLLENGHLLVTEAQGGRVLETSASGEVVWEWVVDPYDESQVPEVAFAARYEYEAQPVEAWECSPQ